ncbi:MAG: amidohydrolase family protein [Aestuariivirga sp.]|nr:amidohydrolase family protein [Aestuariivirga sp.]
MPPATTPPQLITGAQVWDGVAGKPLGPLDILVTGGKIAGLGQNLSAPEGTRRISLPGHMVTPGFIDSHVHVTLRPELEDKIFSLSSSAKALLGVEALGILLDRGFTTVRDVGDMDIHGYTTMDLARAIAERQIAGPRLIPAGHLISTRGGHGDGGPLLGADSDPWQNSLADGVDEIRKVVRREISRGAQWIKYAGSGGFSSPADDPSQVPYSQEEMNVMVETARDLGIPATLHVYGDGGIRRALVAGVRCVEHGNLATPETLGIIEDKGVFLVPTQIAVIRQARQIDDDAFWTAAGKPPYVRAKYRKYAAQLMQAAHNLADSKVQIAFGTDIGTFSFATNNAGEFAEMTANGISTLRALKAGTSVAAELLQQPDIGVLAAGKTADIIAMPGNPFDDITVTEKVEFVMRSGVVHKAPAMP